MIISLPIRWPNLLCHYTYDLIASIEASISAGYSAGFAHIFDAYSNYISPGYVDGDQRDLIADTKTFLSKYYELDEDVFTITDDLVFNNAALHRTEYYSGTYNADDISVNNYLKQAVLNGGRGNDTLTGGMSEDLLDGDEGNDKLSGGNGNDYLFGGNGNDELRGDDGYDLLVGNKGNDSLNGGKGADHLYGGNIKSVLSATDDGNDTLDGGDGNDILEGGTGNDTYKFTGQFGHDMIKDDGGTVEIDGAALTFTQTVEGGIIYKNATYTATKINEGNTTSLIVISTDKSKSITIKDWVDGRYGITLENAKTPTPAANSRTLSGSAISAGNLRDSNPLFDITGIALNATGTPTSQGYGAVIMGMHNTSDTLTGSAKDDLISGGFTTSIDNNSTKAFYASDDNGNFDTIHGMGGNDFIYVSNGGSVAHGDDNNDFLTSDTRAYFQVDNVKKDYPGNIPGPGINAHGDIARDDVWSDVYTPEFMGFYIEDKTTAGANGSVLKEYVVHPDYFKNFTTNYQEFTGGKTQIKFIGKNTGDATVTPVSDGNVKALRASGYYAFTYDYTTNDKLPIPPVVSPVSIWIATFPLDKTQYASFADKQGASLMGDDGNDFLLGGYFSDYLVGGKSQGASGADKDTIFGGYGNDVLDGASDADELYGEGGNDLIIGGDGNDTLWGSSSNADLSVESDNDTLYGGKGTDTLYGGKGDDYLDGGIESDQLNGDDGNDYLYGGDDNVRDTISGGAGNDTLVAGDTLDVLSGGKDDDIYILSTHKVEHAKNNVVVTSARQAAESNNSLAFTASDIGNSAPAFNADSITIDDAVQDVLYGGIGDDTMVMGIDDYAAGGGGNDIYIWDTHQVTTTNVRPVSAAMALSPGLNDATLNTTTVTTRAGRIMDTEGNNTIALVGVGSFADSTLEITGNDLFINTGRSNNLVIQDGAFNTAIDITTANTVNTAEASTTNSTYTAITDDTFLSGTDLRVQSHISLGGLMLTTLNKSATVTGARANDYLTGGLVGDTLTANVGGSRFVGGRGDDILMGDLGDDTYLIRKGDGIDIITEKGGDNTLKVGKGITASSLIVRRTGADLRITVSDEQTITVKNMFNATTGAIINSSSIQHIKFYDETTWDINALKQNAVVGTLTNDTIGGFETADTLNGGKGADQLSGGAGDDLYQYTLGDGSDLITDTAGNDRLELSGGILPNQVTAFRDAYNNLVLKFSDGGRIAVTGAFDSAGNFTANAIETIKFSDNSTWDAARIKQEVLKDPTHIINGTTGDDILVGDTGKDSVNAGKGNDHINGSAGNDIYQYALGDGNDVITDTGGSDRIEFGAGITQTNTLARSNGADLTITLSDGGSTPIDPTITGIINQLQTNWFAQAEILIEDRKAA